MSARDAKIPCYVQLGNETGFPHAGVVDFVDNHVDPNTGTLRARGVLPNSKGYLTPGFFANMRVPGSGRYRALLVPDTETARIQECHIALGHGILELLEDRLVARPL